VKGGEWRVESEEWRVESELEIKRGKSAGSGFDGYSIANITRQIGFIFST
jgi:hypothetical protein